MIIGVIDGQGGGIGRAIVEKIKANYPQHKVLALGTNSWATGQMLRAGADDGATGENAIIYNAQRVDVIVGVIAILSANSLLGEITSSMAVAIGASPAEKILLPLNRCGIQVMGVTEGSTSQQIEEAVAKIGSLAEKKKV